ncbi:MAG TPA: type II toxin-antitoxin system RelE/ParE family toxin [Desulfosporosinus sp.]|nr:type II toxin-antitoxin system RelE/ParE family toxin [Desulfosporosinus sp.]
MTYKLEIAETCLSLLEKITDKRIQSAILDRIKELSVDPEKQGKPLVKELAGFRSLHVSGRYRIIFKIEKDPNVVCIAAAGIRKEGDQKDIYKLAKKLLKLGLIDH